MKKTVSFITKTSLILAAGYCLKLCKISFMVGSHATFFSGANSILPLMGVFGGITGTALLFVFRTLLFSSKTLYSGQFLAYILPGVSASLYWATDNIFVRLLLPLTCMGLFIAHPVGSEAFAYSLFWLIPVALYFIGNKSVIAHSFASTFIAHAVGSVIWLYTVPMHANEWIALIPVVCFERMTFASGMIIMHYAFSYLFATTKTIVNQTNTILCNKKA